MKKLKPLQLTSDKLKSEKGQGNYQDKIKKFQDKESSSYEM